MNTFYSARLLICFNILVFQYQDKEEVVLWMNTVGPYHNRQETYKYFSLPFCVGSKKSISHYHETLGEALQGVELEFSGLDIKFKGKYFKVHLVTKTSLFIHFFYTLFLVFALFTTADSLLYSEFCTMFYLRNFF